MDRIPTRNGFDAAISRTFWLVGASWAAAVLLGLLSSASAAGTFVHDALARIAFALVLLPAGGALLPRGRRALGMLSLAEWMVLAMLCTLVTWLATAYAPFPFVFMSLPLIVAALSGSIHAVAVLGAGEALVHAMLHEGSLSGALEYAAADGEGLGVRMASLCAALVGPLVVAAVIMQLRAQRERLAESEARFRSAMEHSGIGIALVGLDGRWLSFNAEVLRITGYSTEELQRLTFQDITHPDDLDADVEFARQVAHGERRSYQMDKRYLRKDGRVTWVRLTVSAVHEPDGRARYYISQIEDVDALRAADAAKARLRSALESERDRLRVILASIAEAVVVTDDQGRVSFLNGAAEGLVGRPSVAAAGLPLAQVLPLRSASSDTLLEDPARACLGNRMVVTLPEDTVFEDPAGRTVGLQGSCAPVRDADQTLAGTVLVLQDVSAARAARAALEHASQHDALTGLPNRRAFDQQVAGLVASPGGARRTHVVCMVDLDGLKAVNDCFGHAAGDRLLHAAAEAMRAVIRSSDVLARVGGDEFALVFPDCPLERGRQLAGTLSEAVDTLEVPWNGNFLRCGASVGAAAFEPGRTPITTALALADADCYADKARRRAVAVTSASHDTREDAMAASPRG